MPPQTPTAPAPAAPPVMPTPAAPAPTPLPTPAPVAPAPVPEPAPVPPTVPQRPMTPVADMVMPRKAPPMPPADMPAAPHSHTGALVSGALLIGLILGAAGGYYGGKFQAAMEQTAIDMQQTQALLQQQQQEAQSEPQPSGTSADSQLNINTAPLQNTQAPAGSNF